MLINKSIPIRERVVRIIALLEKEYPDVKGTMLRWTNPLELLIATILSAQATDKKVNEVTPYLFSKYKTAEDYANASREELEDALRSIGFHRQKAKFIQESARMIVEEYGGEVPRTMKDLTRLRGVARKTANVVLSNAFGVIEGIAVDTHVIRVSRRLGLTSQTSRDRIERDLMEIVPRSKWFQFHNLIITHGRRVCTARRPNCLECVINRLCPSAFTFPHNKDLRELFLKGEI